MTTVLTMVTFIWSANASLPKISYIKGIDVYLVMCFVMTLSSVIEYACVSFIYNNIDKKREAKENKEKEERKLSTGTTKSTNNNFPSSNSQR